MNIHRLIALASLLGLLGTAAVSAQADTGFYVGGGIGQSSLEDDPASFDESDTAWKAFVGFKLDFIPVVKAAVEAGYRDLGNPAAAGSTFEVRGYDYAALVGIGIGPIDLFGRLGQMKYDFTSSGAPTPAEADGTANVVGVGLAFSLGGIGLRAEYEQLDIDELDNASMISLSVVFGF
jgi:Outer membrane protein beta-barrel domain